MIRGIILEVRKNSAAKLRLLSVMEEKAHAAAES